MQWVFDLEERYVQQISTSMEDLILNQHIDDDCQLDCKYVDDPAAVNSKSSRPAQKAVIGDRAEAKRAQIFELMRHDCKGKECKDPDGNPIFGEFHGRISHQEVEDVICDTSRRIISRAKQLAEVSWLGLQLGFC